MWCVLMYNTGTFCRKTMCCLCTQRAWIIAGMIWFWLLATLLANINVCFSDAIVLEFIFGYRGSTMLVIFFSVLVLIELKYGGALVPGIAWYEQLRHNNDLQHQNGVIIHNAVSLENGFGDNVQPSGVERPNVNLAQTTERDSDEESDSSETNAKQGTANVTTQ
ncbi:hypothetical protein RFI_12650 [Reticulomyxa filosa]|uniref:Uncharacterized protein n=1 Tax=Reticulomyxa filosa TaxID=46433 RepID=X6NGM2_RETFI|nr:hypothetical protein RFI_12650 [Reticulomyxa filosa]|eukprot:ETO24507.1 hypothetical protein RFI_12650 [Reticulomyxa filosa]